MNIISFVAQVVVLLFVSLGLLVAQQLEKTESTIAPIVYPQQELKLWYGSDDFRVDRFVILPKYTLIYNSELSTFRLLDNKENLVKDETRLLAIKSINYYHVAIDGSNQKWALGPSTTWFTVLTDSTVLVGTVLAKNKREVAGYLLVNIKNDKLIVEHKQFSLNSELDHVDPNNMQYITDYIEHRGAQFYSTMFVLSPTPKNKFVVKKSLYLKTNQKPLSLYYSKEEDTLVPVEKKQIFPVQLMETSDRLLIYDPETELVRVITTDTANPTLLDLASALPGNVPKGRKFGRSFMVDRVTNQLYYKTLAFSGGSTDQLVMSAILGVDKITLQPIFRSNMTNYYSTYINNRKLFFYDSKKGYIYVMKVDLP